MDGSRASGALRGSPHRVLRNGCPCAGCSGRATATGPLIVVGHISAPGRLGGPASRAKAFLDALHDDRRSGPKYDGFRLLAPLPDDTPQHVRGLALEVRPGAPQTRYLIGDHLRVAGQLPVTVPVHRAAPNDIAGMLGERARIATARQAFGDAARSAFAQHSLPDMAEISAVVVRHHAQRDEDNTSQAHDACRRQLKLSTVGGRSGCLCTSIELGLYRLNSSCACASGRVPARRWILRRQLSSGRT